MSNHRNNYTQEIHIKKKKQLSCKGDIFLYIHAISFAGRIINFPMMDHLPNIKFSNVSYW